MKIYEVKQQMNNLHWHTLAFLSSRKDAEKYQLLYNTKVVVYPTKIVEHELLRLKDFEEELKENESEG
jgi:hypothetical protein